MKKNLVLAGLALVLLIVGVVLWSQGGNWFNNLLAAENITVGVQIGQQAPDFTLSNLSDQKESLSTYRGKKVFLNFWATWCPPCQSEMPDIQKLADNHPEVAILGIDVREPKGKVIDYLMSRGFNFPILLDKEGKVASTYLVRGIPTTYILDEQGIILEKHIGPLDYEQMLELLNLKD